MEAFLNQLIIRYKNIKVCCWFAIIKYLAETELFGKNVPLFRRAVPALDLAYSLWSEEGAEQSLDAQQVECIFYVQFW